MLGNKLKLAILIGPSASGKTELAKMLESEYNFERVKTVTTRPKRGPEDDEYEFLSHERFYELSNSGLLCAQEIVGDFEYGFKRYHLDRPYQKPGISILSPQGAKDVRSLMPQSRIFCLYDKYSVRLKRLLKVVSPEEAIARLERDKSFDFEGLKNSHPTVTFVDWSTEHIADVINYMFRGEDDATN